MLTGGDSLTVEAIIEQLEPSTLISKRDFERLVHNIEPQYSERSMYWLLSKLKKMWKLQSTGRNSFFVLDQMNPKPEYVYSHSHVMEDVISRIEKEYPLVHFQVWELVQMNEFINHQVARNVLFVEVESMLEETVFNLLSEVYHRVLLRPSNEVFYTYNGENMIVIQKLLSEALKPLAGTHSCCLEKILVDLFSKKLTGHLLQRAEYEMIYETAFNRYCIGEVKMFRYARRRNLEKEIRSFIREKTSLRLLTEG